MRLRWSWVPFLLMGTVCSADHGQFVSAVDLPDPGTGALVPVVRRFREQVARQRWKEACHTFGRYFREHILAGLPDPDDDRLLKASEDYARRLIDGQFEFLENWYSVGKDLPWEDKGHGVEWNASLNRHYHIGKLAYVYRETGDERYAAEALRQLAQWTDRAGTPPHQAGNSPYHPFWQQLNSALRMAVSWPTLKWLRGSVHFSDSIACELARAVFLHGAHLHRFPIASYNVGMHQNVGLLTASLLLENHADSGAWRRQVLSKVENQITTDFYPDGSQIELAYWYGASVADNLLKMRRLLSVYPHLEPFPERILSRLERFYDYTLYSIRPNDYLPEQNDSPPAYGPAFLKKGAALFPTRADFVWKADGAGGPPLKTSAAFPYAGHYAMRSDWSRDGRYLFFDGGPFGFAHQHEDKLTFVLDAFGRALVVEAGMWFPYGPYPEARYARSTFGHNTVAVDTFGQNRAALGPSSPTWVHPFPYSKPLENPWFTDSRVDFVSGSYEDGYGPDRIPVTHRRSVVFVKPDYWVLFDRLTPADGNAHRYEAFFHLDAEAWQEAGNVVRTGNADSNLLIWPLATKPLSHELIRGKPETPGAFPSITSTHSMQGWASLMKTWAAVPTVVYRFAGSGEAALVTLLYPFRPRQSREIVDFRWSGDGVEVKWKSGDIDSIRQAETSGVISLRVTRRGHGGSWSVSYPP